MIGCPVALGLWQERERERESERNERKQRRPVSSDPLQGHDLSDL
jgi:hypothetical protein